MDPAAAVRREGASEATAVACARLSLSTLRPGERATVLSVGTGLSLTPLERRLLELGFVEGERLEVIAEARPGRDPFVVRLGSTALALRRREVESVWVSRQPSGAP